MISKSLNFEMALLGRHTTGLSIAHPLITRYCMDRNNDNALTRIILFAGGLWCICQKEDCCMAQPHRVLYIYIERERERLGVFHWSHFKLSINLCMVPVVRRRLSFLLKVNQTSSWSTFDLKRPHADYLNHDFQLLKRFNRKLIKLFVTSIMDIEMCGIHVGWWLDIEADTKWPPFRRRHCTIQLLVQNVFYSDSFTKILTHVPN